MSLWTEPFCESGWHRAIWRSASFTKPRKELRRAGFASPALANHALNGLEQLLRESYPKKKRFPSLGGQYPCVNLIRYADDFVITGRSKELLEEIKPLVEGFLRERGLELSPVKTVITHVTTGFDFLGQNVRRYPNGKLLIKPSRKNLRSFLEGIRETIRTGLAKTAADLIFVLNRKIRGWANYHRHVVSSRAFRKVDYAIFTSLWQWARRKHPTKSARWIQQKYWGHHRGWNWCFFGVTQAVGGKPSVIWLQHARQTPIRRHIKVRSEANPYDPRWKEYFVRRRTFRSSRDAYFTDPALPGLPASPNRHRVSSRGVRKA